MPGPLDNLEEAIRKLQEMYDDPDIVIPASQLPEKENPYKDFEDRNPMAGGGMLVQPSADGSRPGYAKDKKKVAANLPDKYGKFTGEGLKGMERVSDAILKAYADDDITYLFEKKEKNPKGLISAEDSKQGLFKRIKEDQSRIDFVVKNTGLDEDTIFDILDDRIAYLELEKERPTKPLTDKKIFLNKAEKWLMTNSKRYADPAKFEKAFIRTFGKNNLITKTIKANITDVRGKGRLGGFSDDFIKTIMATSQGVDPTKTSIAFDSRQLKEMFKTVIYNNNPNVRKRITKIFENIIPEPGSKRTPDVRKLFENDPVLKKFGLDKSIKGPIARLILNEIGEDLFTNVRNFQKPFLGTDALLNYLKDRVDPKYKEMFREASNAVKQAQKNQWPQAKKSLNLSQSIMFDHKIPKSIIEKGYADEIEYIKLNPTSEKFNATIKRSQFDQPLLNLIDEFERSKTLDAKANVVTKMNKLKNDFSKKYGGYLDEVSINVDKTGKPIFTSSASPVTKKTDLVSSLGKSMTQTGEINNKQLETLLASFGDGKCAVTFGKNKRDGGRIGYQTGTPGLNQCIESGIKNINEGKFKTADQVQDAAKLLSGGRRVLSGLMKYGIIPELAYVGLEATGRSILGEKPLNAIKKSIDTFTFGLTDFTSGIEAEKFGKFGDLKLDVDKYRNSLAKVNSIQQDIANLETLNTGSQFGYEGDQTEAIQMKKAQLEAAKKELQQNMISPDKVSFIDRMSDNIADAQMAKSAYAKASAKDQMIGMPGVADYMDTDQETARVFPRQPSQVELNLNMLPSFQDYQKSDAGKVDKTIMNAPDEVLKEISPDALEMKKALQEAYKMENLKDIYGAEQIYGTQGSFFGEPLAKGGRAGFKLGSVRKGILKLIDDSVKSTPKDTTTELDKLIKKTLDEDLFDKKDRIVDSINISEAKKRKNYPYNMRVFEEPKNLDFYRAIKESNFRTKTGPFFDRTKKAGGGLLKQAGDRSGPPPESGPNPQGLQGLLNRVKKT